MQRNAKSSRGLNALNRRGVFLTSVTCLFWTTSLLADTYNFPRVRVTAQGIDGVTIICRDTACEGVLRALGGTHYSESSKPYLPDTVTIPLNPDEVCANLKQARPQDCSPSNPPSVPGYNPDWLANGCGDGTFASDFGEFMSGVFLPDHTGDLNNPLPNISFYGACAGHDRCYGTGGPFYSKGMCDHAFSYAMKLACDAGSSTYASQCETIRNSYVDAVQTTFGESAYDSAQQQVACASWVSDMEENKCVE